MRTRTANWFLCKVRYDKTMEDGLQKKVTETYVLDAISFAQAERIITEEMSHYISGEFEVAEIDRAVWSAVFFSDEADADKWYKSKVQFITIDEKAEKEKKTSVYYLVQGKSLEDARANIDKVMGATMMDYVISSVSETNIMDVFEQH